MRAIWVALALILSMATAHAQKFVVSGKPLLLFQATSANPDCTSAGNVVMRVSQQPEHGRVSIQPTSISPRFSQANPLSACNVRRIRGVRATYVSQRGYTGPDLVLLQIFFPAGRAYTVRFPIRVM